MLCCFVGGFGHGRRGGGAVLGAFGQKEVEHHGHHGRETDAGQRETTVLEGRSADARGERHGNDDHIARRGEVDAAVEQTRDAGPRNGAEEQQHDAAENGLVDAAQQGADFTHQREDDAGEGGDAENKGIGDARERHGARHFGVGGDGGRADERSKETGRAVAQHRAVQSGRFDKVLARHVVHHVDIADVFDDRRDGHRDHEENGGPRKFLGQDEVGQTEPGSGGHLREIDVEEREVGYIAHHDAEEDGDELEHAPPVERDAHGGGERDARQDPVGRGHLHRRTREREADEHDDGTDHHGRKQPIDEPQTEKADEERHESVDRGHAHAAEESTPQAVELGGLDNGRNKGKAATEKDRNFALGDEVKKKGTHTGREKGRGGVETHEQGHEHSGAEGHKKVLHAGQCLACGTESDGGGRHE